MLSFVSFLIIKLIIDIGFKGKNFCKNLLANKNTIFALIKSFNNWHSNFICI